MIPSEEPLELLRLLAAYKKPMSTALLAAVAQRPIERIDEALDELSRRRMVTAVDAAERLFRTTHDALRTTVYEDIGAETSGRFTLRIARGLERVARSPGNPGFPSWPTIIGRVVNATTP